MKFTWFLRRIFITRKCIICKEPIYRTTPFKREICDVLLAVNRAYNKSDYLPCIAWGRNARYVKNIQIGQKVCVFGRIQSREYQKRLSETETQTRVAYEISISKIKVEGLLTEGEQEENNSYAPVLNMPEKVESKEVLTQEEIV